MGFTPFVCSHHLDVWCHQTRAPQLPLSCTRLWFPMHCNYSQGGMGKVDQSRGRR